MADAASTTHLISLNWADYAIAGIIVFSVLISLVRGFVREFLSLLTWGVAFWVAVHFDSQLSDLLASRIAAQSLRAVVSFMILLVITLIIGALVNFLISRLVSSTGLSGTDRALGMLFGLARGILLVGVVLLLASLTSFVHDPWWQASSIIPHFQPLVTWLQGFLPDKVGHLSGMIHHVS